MRQRLAATWPLPQLDAQSKWRQTRFSRCGASLAAGLNLESIKVSIGILLGSVNVTAIQFSSTGKVTSVRAEWLGMSVSDKASKQLNKALEELFGNTSSSLATRLDQSIISNAANAILDVARNNTTGFCADITVTTKK
jgi:hypothetical protein